MKARFQADADFNEDIVSGVLRRIPEIDFKTATEAGLEGLPDSEILARSSFENRILVTHDRRTMPQHFARFIQESECPGVIVVSKKLEISAVIDELILIWAAAEAEEFTNSIKLFPL